MSVFSSKSPPLHHVVSDEESLSSLSSNESQASQLSRKSIVFTHHIIDRCDERGISAHKLRQIIQSDNYKYVLPDGKREYCKDGICCITAQGDDGEEVGITAYETHCKDCGINTSRICEKGYCYRCCWGCDECAKYKCFVCETITPLAKDGVVSLLCKNGLCIECCSGCTQCRGKQCKQCEKRGDHKCQGPLCDQCGKRGFDHCKKRSEVICKSCCPGCYKCLGPSCCKCDVRGFDHCDKPAGIFCKACCFGCDDCLGPRCFNCRVHGTNHCDNYRGVFCKGCCYGCEDCWGSRCSRCDLHGEDLCKTDSRLYCKSCCPGCDKRCSVCSSHELDYSCIYGVVYCKSCSRTKSSKIRITPSILFNLGEDNALGPILIRKMLAKGATGDYHFKETLKEFCSIPEVKSKIMQWQ